MQLLASEFAERAERTPGDVAVIDALGVHTVGEVMAAARALAIALEESLGGSPTVLVQADNTWRTLATALAVGLRGGMVAVLSGHAVEAEFELAMEDIEPDAVVAVRRRPGALGGLERRVPRQAGGPRRLGARHVRPAGQRRRPLGRWCRGGDDVRLDRPREVCRAVRGVAPVRRPVDDRRDRALARRRRRGVRPAVVGGGVLLRDVPPRDARRSDGVHRDLAARRGAGGDGGPRRPLDHAGADDGAAALGPPDGRGQAVGPEGDDRGRWPHGRRCPRSRRAGPRHEADPGVRHVGVPRPHHHAARRGRRDAGWPATVGRSPAPWCARWARVGGRCRRARWAPPRCAAPACSSAMHARGARSRRGSRADGFLPTGDLVRLNPEGTITILGREKQIIIRGGRNIDVNEVEAAVARIPSVAQVCVVPLPDEMLGERVAALVVSAGQPLVLADVTDHLEAEGFPKAKWPEFVFVVPDLPQNRVGKLSRPDAVRLATRAPRNDLSSSHVGRIDLTIGECSAQSSAQSSQSNFERGGDRRADDAGDRGTAVEARRHPHCSDREVRQGRLRAHQVGDHRRPGRYRADGALPLLRVQGALPAHDHEPRARPIPPGRP